jgi:hypothetical protein
VVMPASMKARTARRNVGAAVAGPSVTTNARASSTRSTARGCAAGATARAARQTSSRSPPAARRPANSAASHAVR